MKIKELIKMLEKFNPEATILIAHDEEGNSYQDQAYIQEFPKEVILYPSGNYIGDLEPISDEQWSKFYEEQLKLNKKTNV